MVQIIPAARTKPSFSEKLSGAIGTGLNMAGEGLRGYKESEALRQQGIDPNLSKEFQQLSYKAKLRKEEMADKLKGSSTVELRDYEVVKSTFGDKFANLWKAAPVGGKTQLLQYGIESLERGADLDNLLKNVDTSNINNEQNQNQKLDTQEKLFDVSDSEFDKSNSENIQNEKPKKTQNVFEKEFSDYLKKQNEGLTKSEIVSRGKERYNSGLKTYQESGEKLRSSSTDKERIAILKTLNSSKKLPKNLGRLNVDADGNLRAPFLANPETQRYVKTLNEFSSSAKQTFGSRVTNFDLQQYLKRFPTLMNTEEGRNQLIKQMEIFNQMNSIYYKNLKNIYDKAGGVRNIDSDVAERFAEKLSEKETEKLSSKLEEIGQFSSKPEASEFLGRSIKDKKTGEVFVSDGINWIPKGQ